MPTEKWYEIARLTIICFTRINMESLSILGIATRCSIYTDFRFISTEILNFFFGWPPPPRKKVLCVISSPFNSLFVIKITELDLFCSATFKSPFHPYIIINLNQFPPKIDFSVSVSELLWQKTVCFPVMKCHSLKYFICIAYTCIYNASYKSYMSLFIEYQMTD